MEKKKKELSLNAFVIIFIIIVFCALMTWIIPAGEFDTALDEATGRELTVPGSYHSIEASPVGPWKLLQTLYEGFVDASNIMFFVAFAVFYIYLLTQTGALNAVCGALMRKIGSRDQLLIPLFMIMFGIAGTTFGMYEETFALIPVFVVIAITLGYDNVVGGMMVYGGAAIGFSSAVINPFNMGLASGIAGIPMVSLGVTVLRLCAFVAFSALAIVYTMHYANKIRKDPRKSVMYGSQATVQFNTASREECMNAPFTKYQKISVAGFVLMITILVFGIIKLGWWFSDMSALFFIFAIVTGIINKMSVNEIADTFVEAVKSVLGGIMIIGFARSISLVLTAGGIIHTIVNCLATLVGTLPNALIGVGMVIVQNIINFFIPSASGQAMVMMPIMAPLADVVGISREMAVVAFHFGDGFSKMFWPTSVAAQCGIMGVSLPQWYKFITKLFLMMFLLQCVFMIIGVSIGI